MSVQKLTEAMAAHPAPESVTATEQPAGAASQTATPPASATVLAETDAGDLDAAKREAPLLARIQQDTGETGRASGGRIDFTVCPICGHRDCFSYYTATNSWSCFSASNSTGVIGGSYVDYLVAREGVTVAEAVARLRDVTGHPLPAKGEGGGNKADAGKDGKDAKAKDAGRPQLPPFEPVRASDPPKRRPPLIGGVLRSGHVSLLAGKGKSGKSWAAIRLACAVATGSEWFGWPCARGRVLYLDPEIDPPSLDNRFASVCEAGGYDARAIDANVLKWPLRGVRGATIGRAAEAIAGAFPAGSLALVVIDSCSVFVEGDENGSTDVRNFFAPVLDIARRTGAALLLVHHFGKGSAGDREAADRARGSSVWLDAPDVALTLTEVFPPSGDPADHLAEGERAFLLEVAGIREFAAPAPVRLVWSYPLHRIDAEGVTDGWKPRSSSSNGGRATAKHNKAQSAGRADACMLALASEFMERGEACEGIPAGEASEVCTEALGESVNTQTLKKYVAASGLFDVEQVNKNRWRVVRAVRDE